MAWLILFAIATIAWMAFKRHAEFKNFSRYRFDGAASEILARKRLLSSIGSLLMDGVMVGGAATILGMVIYLVGLLVFLG